MSQNTLQFEQRMKRLFEDQSRFVGTAVRSRLRSARERALRPELDHPKHWWIPATATAALIAAAVLTPWKTQPVLNEAELMTVAQEVTINADLINEDPEFYLWLANAPVATEGEEKSEELL